jgi:hypothetical protein
VALTETSASYSPVIWVATLPSMVPVSIALYLTMLAFTSATDACPCSRTA